MAPTLARAWTYFQFSSILPRRGITGRSYGVHVRSAPIGNRCLLWAILGLHLATGNRSVRQPFERWSEVLAHWIGCGADVHKPRNG